MPVFDLTYKLIRWTFGALFIFSGGAKLMEPVTFAVLIDAYGLVPKGLLMHAALGLSVLEMAAGIGLLFDIRGSLGVIAGLPAVFIAILGYGISMGLDVVDFKKMSARFDFN